DERSDLSFLPPLDEGGEVGSVALGFLTGEAAPEHAHQARSLEERKVDGKRRDGSAGEADDQVAFVPRQRPECWLGLVTAYRVVGHVHAVRSHLTESLPEFSAVVADDGVGAGVGYDLLLLV